ncbi:MAG: aconitate hydratase, partial [Clostridia bacterium]|nr:aconitate hydratase [Clostridia bacterium]
MPQTLAYKILQAHLVEGTGSSGPALKPGAEIAIRIDQTLTQDSTGTMAYLQFETMGIDRVRTQRSLAYVDHNTLQAGFENADDHRYIQTVAAKHGIWFSRPGNGVCHQVHIERFGKPGTTLLGSDSHTPTGGGLGQIAIGAGGLDVAVAMGGGAYYLPCPSVLNIKLTGKLKPYVAAKDIILEVLRKLTVKGGVGKIIEYTGPALKFLTVPERATITNMGAELGATCSIFPSDDITREFLKAQGREADWTELSPDPDCQYDGVLEINLDNLQPLAACPHSPDIVMPVSQLGPIKVQQVAIGSCTNSSLQDMLKVAAILKGLRVNPEVSLVIAPGSRQVLQMLAQNGALADMIAAGARILECVCGPCIGMGQAPETNAVSVRTFNRNFEGRSGTASAKVFLTSPETAAATAIAGVLVDPTTLDYSISIKMPKEFLVDDSQVIAPSFSGEVQRGPNIKSFPATSAMPVQLQGEALLKIEDNITTDHIMPSNAKLLPYRSNIPYLSEYCLAPIDAEFPA